LQPGTLRNGIIIQEALVHTLSNVLECAESGQPSQLTYCGASGSHQAPSIRQLCLFRVKQTKQLGLMIDELCWWGKPVFDTEGFRPILANSLTALSLATMWQLHVKITPL
jgi:hypothetical protein